MPIIKAPIKCLAALAALTACENQTSIQNAYVANRNTCQLMAEQNIDRFMAPGESNLRARNAKLVTLFSDCMFDQGWTVATPEREDEMAFEDDLPQLNDVPAGTSPATAAAQQQQPTPTMGAPATGAAAPAAPLDPNRRAPSQQYQ